MTTTQIVVKELKHIAKHGQKELLNCYEKTVNWTPHIELSEQFYTVVENDKSKSFLAWVIYTHDTDAF